ncbi:LacI family DNA-binding transcriptional regulator [Paenibacillus sp. YYML68]|uniref:LacI family DNA-binding transcriptional regulator n=1 Tax=Paenibacillus sp. YYML68 TaxID=2909250 RepID=UPI0037CC5C6E
MARQKKVSMQDIADRLDISKNAVSLALQHKKGISEELRLRVLETAKELGYGTLSSETLGQPSGNVLVLVPERVMTYEDNDHFQFFHDMIWGLERSIRRKGINAIIVPITSEMESSRTLPQHCRDIAHQGIVLFGIVDKAYAGVVWELDTPLVMLDSYHREWPCPAVASANLEGAYEAVSLLIRSGHREIGFIGPANLTTSFEERWYGYWRAMQEHGLAVDMTKGLTHLRSLDNTEAELGQFLSGLPRESMPTAFFCGNDRIAYLLIRQLRERGLRVPDDVSVVGFDDLKYEDEAGLRLTTMRVDKDQLCERAAELLLSLTGPSRELLRVYIKPTLVVQDTVKQLGGRYSKTTST